jgi:AcrR family transcriptional regulator
MPKTAPRRGRILKHARDLLARGDRPSVDSIASAAGVSKAAFYREFPSRSALIDELNLDPEPGARDRIMRAALELIGAEGLAAMSMDEVASRAGVSRATLYRLFAGKPALFAGVVREFSPLEPVMETLSALQDEPPEVVMPAVARTVYRAVAGPGGPGVGLLRAVFLEISSFSSEAEEAARDVATTALGSVGLYVASQMGAGRLRPMHPLLAMQSFIGPILFHLLTRPLAERAMGMDMDGDQAVTLLAEIWLRSMRPDHDGGSDVE